MTNLHSIKKKIKKKKNKQANFATSVTNSCELFNVDRRALPIFSCRQRLLDRIAANATLIVLGETGSGKTTQIAQYIYEENLNRGQMIACTQPRRVAATSIAARVALESGNQLGDKVGYHVRFENKTNNNTIIKFMTDGMLLRESIADPLLLKYSIILLDEAHERTIHTDVLFGVVKMAQKLRRHAKYQDNVLKVVVMSATMDVDSFSRYFNDAPVMYIEGRQFPVKIMYTEENIDDYTFSCASTAIQIHSNYPSGEDILIFLTGQEEIERAVRQLRSISLVLSNDLPTLLVLPLYAALPSHQQQKVFKPTPKGHRKIIISTNIAETSLTLPGIKHVIDCGYVKQKDHKQRMELLQCKRISRAQAWQRSGRAGRSESGICYRMYTESSFLDNKVFAEQTVPEILRCNLSGVVLQLITLGIHNLYSFDFIDKPSVESLNVAMDLLVTLEAIKCNDNKDYAELTETGKLMSHFPLDPQISKCIITAAKQDCLRDMLAIASTISGEGILNFPSDEKSLENAHKSHGKFKSHDGDLYTQLNTFNCFFSANSKKWCHENYINYRNISQAQKVFQQLTTICRGLGWSVQGGNQNLDRLTSCIISGFFNNSAELDSNGQYRSIVSDRRVHIHPTSVLFGMRPPCIIYTELVQTSKNYMRNLLALNNDELKDHINKMAAQKVAITDKSHLSNNK